MRMSELLNEVNKFELDEGFSPKEIKMAIGIASDPRYKGGNMTGAVNAIDKVKKGLSDHPKVAAVLKRQNEDTNEAVSPAQQAAIAISKKEKTKNEVLDKDDEKTVGDVVKGLKKAVKAHQGQVKNLTKDIQDQVELDELTSEEKKLLDKMFDKKGNLTPLGKKVMDQGKKEEVEENTLDIGDESDYTLDEGKMKDLHGYISSGKSAEEIAKIMKIDAGTVKTLMNDFKKEGFSSDAQRKAAFASGYKEKDKKDKKEDVKVIEGYFPEQKSSTGYDLYHKDFSGAMQHAYAHAKKKLGITIDNDEIDDKVASGPRKPSKGKTNSYRLKGDKGAVQIQVYNMGSRFELNMYKESIDEAMNNTHALIDTADGNKVKAMASSEQGVKQSKASAERPPMSVKNKNTLKIVTLTKPQSQKASEKLIGYSLSKGMDKFPTNTSATQGKRMEEVEIDEGKTKPVSQMTPKEKAADAARRKEYKSFQKSKRGEEVEIDEAISGDQYYYVDPKGVVAAVGSKDAMRKMNMKQAKDGNRGGSFSQNSKKYKVGDKIKEEVELEKEVQESRDIPKIDLHPALEKAKIKHTHKQSAFKRSKTYVTVSKSDFDKALKVLGKDAAYKGGNVFVDIDESVELDEVSKEGTMRVIDLARQNNPEVRKQLNVANAGNKGYQVQRMTKGKFANQGKPYAKLKDAQKVQQGGQHSMQFETIDESVKLGGMPAGISKERIKADRDVYAQVLGIKEALDPADFDISATSKDKDNATKNIILQLRKVLSLNGKNPVEFSSGKKEKVHPNVAAAALTKFEKLRRTDQKDEFQQKIAKSYKDLLNAVKGK